MKKDKLDNGMEGAEHIMVCLSAATRKRNKFFVKIYGLPIAKPTNPWYNGQAVKNANSR